LKFSLFSFFVFVAVTPVVGFLGDMNQQKVDALPKSVEEIDAVFHVTLENLTGPGCRVDEKLGRGVVARFVKSPYPVRNSIVSIKANVSSFES
jgi:hypothetical protein